MKRALLLVGIIGLVAGFAASAAPLGLCNYVSQQSDIRHLSLSLSYRYFDDLETTGVDVNGGRAASRFQPSSTTLRTSGSRLPGTAR